MMGKMDKAPILSKRTLWPERDKHYTHKHDGLFNGRCGKTTMLKTAWEILPWSRWATEVSGRLIGISRVWGKI